MLLVETVYDLLQGKAAIIGAAGRWPTPAATVPLMVQVTVETTGRMLVGSEIGAALTALEAMRPDVIGLNCATGPAEMTEHLRYLAQHARTILSCLPNAGLPSVVDGHTHYDLTPDGLADAHERFVDRVRAQHRRRLLRHHARAPAPRSSIALGNDRAGRARTVEFEPGCSSHLQPRAVPPGARVPRDRRAHQRQRLEEVPRRDARGRLGHLRPDGEGPGEGRRARPRRVRRLRRATTAASTWSRSRQPLRHPGGAAARVRLDRARRCIETGLQHSGGKAILNSANLEDGEHRGLALRPRVLAGPGVRRRRHLPRHRRGGPGPRRRLEAAGLQADLRPRRPRSTASTPPTSSSTCSRSRSAPGRRSSAATASRPSRRSGASRPSCRARRPCSASRTSASGSSPRSATCSTACSCTSAARPGSTPPSSHAARIMPMHKIDDHVREVTLDLVYDRRRDGYDPLTRADGALRRRRGRRDRAGGPLGLDDRGAALAPHHRRRARRPRGRARRALAGGRPRCRSSTTCCSRA